MTNWPTLPLAELCEINIGRTPARHRPEYWSAGIPWLSIADMNQGRLLSRTKEEISPMAAATVMGAPVSPGTVALSFKLSLGKVGVVQVPMYTNEAIATLPVRNPKMLLRDFLYWSLRTIDIAADADRAAMGQTLNKEKLARIRVPLPSMQEQRRIVATLDRVDALRAKRRKSMCCIEDLVRSVFFDMFGDPGSNAHSFPWTSLAELVSEHDRINYGVVQPGGDYESGVPLIRVGDLDDGRIKIGSLKLIDPEIESKYARSRLKGNEILVGCVGSIGLIAITTKEHKGFNIARAVARIPIDDPDMRSYLAEYLKTPHIQNYFRNELRTVAQPTLNIKQLAETPVIMPPEGIRARFRSTLEAITLQKWQTATHLRHLDGLLASLQHRAFRGEL